MSGAEFGETQHIALAMIMAKLSGERVIAPRWLAEGDQMKEGAKPSQGHQKEFLAKVYRMLNQDDPASIEDIGETRGYEILPHNAASMQVAEMIKDVEG
ncbi:MAG TPA: hypothetical protein VHX88_09300, partial [Solirubrobacteraceae bacterium]|nr:hypothetical protein [Solirubrobacteraceae bacterium]